MLLLRLCPVLPFNAMNYLMGITSVEAKDYIVGCVGMIPGTLVYVFVGTTISDIADTAKGKSENNTLILVFLIVGSIIGCGGIIYISMVAKRMLNEKLQVDEDGNAQPIGSVQVSELEGDYLPHRDE